MRGVYKLAYFSVSYYYMKYPHINSYIQFVFLPLNEMHYMAQAKLYYSVIIFEIQRNSRSFMLQQFLLLLSYNFHIYFFLFCVSFCWMLQICINILTAESAWVHTLKCQATSIHSAAKIPIVLNQFHTKMWHIWKKLLVNKTTFWKDQPVV